MQTNNKIWTCIYETDKTRGLYSGLASCDSREAWDTISKELGESQSIVALIPGDLRECVLLRTPTRRRSEQQLIDIWDLSACHDSELINALKPS